MTNNKLLELGKAGNAICDIADYGRSRKALIGKDNVFDFSMGNPSVPAPESVRDAISKLNSCNDSTLIHSYTTEAGILNVRKSIADDLNNKYHASVDENLIYLTSGASAALSITLKALLNEDEEVIVFAPYFPDYFSYITNANANMVVVKSKEPSFAPDLVEFEKKITCKTKVVLINYPNNPSGAILCEQELREMVEIIKKKQNEYGTVIYLFSDEPYREIVYNNEVVPFITNYYDNSIVCYSFSKSLSIPGERLGYLLVNPKCKYASDVYTSVVASGRLMGYVCAPSLFQQIIPYCLGTTSNFNIYKENRDLLYKALVEYGYDVVEPRGAFYIFMKSLEKDAFKFCERAKKYEILLVPGDAFGYSGYVRISYCVSHETIERSLSSFKKLIEEYKKDE